MLNSIETENNRACKCQFSGGGYQQKGKGWLDFRVKVDEEWGQGSMGNKKRGRREATLDVLKIFESSLSRIECK